MRLRVLYTGQRARARVLNWREQGLEPRLAAGLGLVEAMTTSPEPLGLEHVRQAREQGLSDCRAVTESRWRPA